MMYPYPNVHDEFMTIAAVTAGKSLARVGDGELKLIHGGSAMREPPNPKLARELLDVVQRPHKNLIVGIPTFDPTGPKYLNWTKHGVRFCEILKPEIQYYSAFVSRPDSAPRIETKEFALSVQALWSDKRVTLVCEKEAFMLRTINRKPGAPRWLHHIECPHRETYEKIREIEREIIDSKPHFVILSCGPAATVLAHRLAERDIHAIDLGSAGRFLYRCIWPEHYAANFAGKKGKDND